MQFISENRDSAAGDRETTADLHGGPSTLRMAELLGSGRHGVVIRAQQTTPTGETDVAVKIPIGERSLDCEATALRRFAHRNVVAVLDGPLPNGSLILEYCNEGTLAQLTKTRFLTPVEVCTLVHSITAALRPIHAESWIHGDINPCNIGMRADDEPALLDFAIARPADGSPLDEGTAEFAGPFRQAVLQLDVRCLAASALSALHPDDHDVADLRQHFGRVVEQCDAGDVVTLDDLVSEDALISDGSKPLAPEPSTLPPHRSTSGGGQPPSTPQTRSFGPRPSDSGDEPDSDTGDHTNKSVHPGWLVALAIGIAVLGATFLTELTGPTTSALTDPLEPAQLEYLLTPQETLASADSTWDRTLGVLERVMPDGNVARLAVGEPGDLAAVGDWNCDGITTLAVFRPGSRNWFIFSSWDADTTSTVEYLEAERGSSNGVADIDFVVQVDAAGCAVPLLLT